MTTGSLRLRLILAASTAISLALALAGIASYYQFQSRVQRLALSELNAHFEQLVSKIEVDDAGQLSVESELSDPRFEKQFGGMYWQIEVPDRPPVRSRSLWDEVLKVPTPPLTEGEEHTHELPGPNGSTLLSVEKIVTIEQPSGKPITALITVGTDQSTISEATRGFGNDVAGGLALLYLALLAASLAQIMLGLRPLEAIRRGLEEIRGGKSERMDAIVPTEVQPLVSEINSLLESREVQLEQSRHRAGNLAHGLKTPLTVLETIAGDLHAAGQNNASAEIRSLINDMNKLVERELNRARVSAENRYAKTKLEPLVQRMIKTLKNVPTSAALSWETMLSDDCELPIEAGDLTEILGNLMDNARKHASTKVKVTANPAQIIVEDDGPGVATEQRSEILKRGVKLDELVAGSGLGLAIVQDLAASYKADLTLDESPLGGLRATFTLQPRNIALP